MTRIDDIIQYKTLIEEAEKIRHELLGSSTTVCDFYINEYNDFMIINGAVLYVTKITNCATYHPPIAYKSDTKIFENLENGLLDRFVIQFNDQSLLQYLSYLFRIYHDNSINLPVLAHDNDLMSNESFVAVSKIRAADGLRYFTVNNYETMSSYKVPVYSGIFKVKAKDNVSIQILDWDSEHLLNKLTVTKNKSDSGVNIYFRTLKIGG